MPWRVVDLRQRAAAVDVMGIFAASAMRKLTRTDNVLLNQALVEPATGAGVPGIMRTSAMRTHIVADTTLTIRERQKQTYSCT